MPKSNAIDPKVLEQAADWLMRLSASDITEAERLACVCWQQQHPEHARAWARAELLLDKLAALPPALAIPALDRPDNPGRRAMLNKLAVLLALAPIGWGSWRVAESQGWTADYYTASGEKRAIQLADGTELTLNTATSVDIQFTATQRLVWLRSGEILLHTAKDNAVTARPFRVATQQGLLEALGTRFAVYQQQTTTQLSVLAGAVKIMPAEAAVSQQVIVSAGEQSRFSRYAVEPVKPLDNAATAWTQGMLLADKMPLAEFVAEISRYRRGRVRCEPSIARLPVSGSYPVFNTELALRMLVSTYPISLTSHMQGYWLNLQPA